MGPAGLQFEGRKEGSHWVWNHAWNIKRGVEEKALQLVFTKWLLTGSKCRSDRIFCRVGWKGKSSGGRGGGGMKMEGKKK